MSAGHDISAANAHYAAELDVGGLSRKPRRRIVVVTCTDARTDPLAILGLRTGDAYVLRNAGRIVTEDVLGSL